MQMTFCDTQYSCEYKTIHHFLSSSGHVIASRLFYVPESELTDEVATTVGSLLTLKDLSYRMEPLIEKVPFMMAQAIYFMTKLARMPSQMFLLSQSCVVFAH